MVWRPSTSRWWVGSEGLGIPSLHLGCHFLTRLRPRSSLFLAVTCSWLVAGILQFSLCSLWLSAGPRAGRYRPDEHHCSWLVLLVTILLALCPFLSFAGRRCSASWLVWTRRTIIRFFLAVACTRLVLLVLFISRCVSSLVGRPIMLGIMAGMD